MLTEWCIQSAVDSAHTDDLSHGIVPVRATLDG